MSDISAADILGITKSVTKEWTKQRKAEERGRRSRCSRMYIYSDRVDFTDVAGGILPDAYAHASGNGKYTVSKRQLYYASRKQFKKQTGREIEYPYFSNTLLVQYLNRHQQLTAAWKVTADPRGTLTIPNASHEVRVPCGTLQIEDHLRGAGHKIDALVIDAMLRTEWPSLASGQRYQAVLYIEKEGFEPVLNEAKISERFDLAILSCKGQSVVAARQFVDQVCRVDGGVPLFVIHDFDKSGFEISQRLTSVSDWAEINDRVRYRFKNRIRVVDLGLRLADVEQYGLVDETCEFNGRFARDSICTAAEREFLQSGRRVELNAFSSPDLVEWIEAKLNENLKGRLIPSDEVLEDAYRRALAIAKINSVLEDAVDSAVEAAEKAKVSKRKLRQAIKANGDDAWDKVLYNLAVEELEDNDG